MAEEKERLSPSAAKAKRNLWFFAAIAWALALCWIRPSQEGRVVIAGIGAETSVQVILGALAVVLVFNLFSFWLHGPFGDKRKDARIWHLLHPRVGIEASCRDLFDHISFAAGESSLPGGARAGDQLERWIGIQLENDRWWQSESKRAAGFLALWNSLSRRTRMSLRWSALGSRRARLLVFEDLWDVWTPLVIGTSGLVAVAIAWSRLG